MYFSGVISTFILAFLVFMYQSSLRNKKGANESFFNAIFYSFFAAIFFSILSWLGTVIIIGMVLTGQVWGLRKE